MCVCVCVCVFVLNEKVGMPCSTLLLTAHAESGPALPGACLAWLLVACLLLSISRCDLLRPSSIYMQTHTHTQTRTNTSKFTSSCSALQWSLLYALSLNDVCVCMQAPACMCWCVCVCSSGFCHSRSLLSHRPHTSHASPSLSDRVALQEVCINRNVTLYGRILKYSYTLHFEREAHPPYTN